MSGIKRKKLWGGRFTGSTDPAVEKFTHSLAVDRRLARHDLLGSIAHARMLGKTRIIPASDSQRLVKALNALLKQFNQGRLKFDSSIEDVHTAIQLTLEKRIGPAAQRLHTARSRNDQVVTALRLFCKEKLQELQATVTRLQQAVVAQAEKTEDFIMPGCTHLRHAQPVLVAHMLLSYVVMLERDKERLEGILQRTDELPLGSGALTGTTLPIDRSFVARQLGFSRVSENSIDAVSDRDFVMEFLAALSILGIHLARIAEDLLIWSTPEFGFIRLDQRLLTGSSMMPQKQNPDFLELVRASSARVNGNCAALLGLLKGLPTGYQRDLQLDKEIFFEALDRIEGMLAVLTRGIPGMRWNRKALGSQLADESLYATDLAEYLVRKGVPFSQAHRAVGQLLSYSDQKKIALRVIPLTVYRRFSSSFDRQVYKLLDPVVSVNRKRSAGSTNPRLVAQAIRHWKTRLR